MNRKYAPTEFSDFNTRLGFLVEECGEVLHAAGKILRWGQNCWNPEVPVKDRETNLEYLNREIRDLQYAIKLIKGTNGKSKR